MFSKLRDFFIIRYKSSELELKELKRLHRVIDDYAIYRDRHRKGSKFWLKYNKKVIEAQEAYDKKKEELTK